MAKAKKNTMWLLLAAGLGICCFLNIMYVNKTIIYDATGETLYNPLMGFAVNADYVEAVGENTLVYVEITWREWEPEEGVYDIEGVKEENNWDRWSERDMSFLILMLFRMRILWQEDLLLRRQGLGLVCITT